MTHYYFSLQYSAVQKTILRHDRLWSMAGISQILSWLNEVRLPEIAREKSGTVIVAGGGKFTAKFDSIAGAANAKKEIIRLISTELPMLEFQTSEIVEAKSLEKAKEPKIKEDISVEHPGIINELNEQKRCFRGYGLTFNPHFMVCEECGEYPATEKLWKDNKPKQRCTVCRNAKDAADISLNGLKNRKDNEKMTSMEKIYNMYVKGLEYENIEIPTDFEDLFPSDDKSEEGKKRLAVWASDINGMGDKVTVWLRQAEDKIKETFDKVKDVNINIVSEALKKTFLKNKFVTRKDKESGKTETFIPFRLIVAGGDDLCAVMKAEDILEFARNISESLTDKIDEINKLGKYHTLNNAWFESYAEDKEKKKGFKPHSFGSSFIVAPIHTPFKKLHHVAEDLMGKAKKETLRQGNSVNWLIMSADEKPETERLLDFEKPLFIDKLQKPDDPKKSEADGYLLFIDYIALAKDYKNLSGSHTQQIVGKMIEFNNDANKLETWLKRKPASSKETSAINNLLREKSLRDNDKKLNLKRLATLLELMSIYKNDK